ncbi:MAG: PAS domain S-box protein [Deltaproteobacteria bacterium]|nr:PAS domain S-box protein [Deltaproteobacteria bacterium]
MPAYNTSHNKVKIDDPLYNSRLIKNYIEYCKEFHPEVDINSLISHAGIATYELEDQGHWFSQRQVDRFHEILVEKTGDSNISRKVGRYAASSKASGAVRQYTLGFMSPAAAYWIAEKIAPHLTRASTLKTRRLRPNRIEVSATPKPGVLQKPYQCNNLIGNLEALSKLFTNKFAKIEHPTCIHKGGDICRYIITWEKTPSLIWKRIRNYSFLLGILISLGLFFVLPLMPWVFLILLCTLITIIFSFYSEHLEKKELTKTIETQGDAAKDLLDEINIRYNNALLVQEIGQATSMLLDIQKLLKSVMDTMEQRLDFDRGGIWLASSENNHLVYNVGYGYNSEIEEILRKSDFHLDHPHSKGVAVQAFKQQKPYLVNDIAEIEKDLSKRSLEFVKWTGAQSFICAPVIYEGESLGVLFVDNLTSKRPLSQSDMSLLIGIASQTAISINNAISFQKLRESEEKYRTILESIEEGYYEVDIDGKFTFVNDSMCEILGYSKDELIGMDNRQYMDQDNASKLHQFFTKVYKTGRFNNRFDCESIKKDNTKVQVEISVSLIKDSKGKAIGFRGIMVDITERKRAAQEKQRLEAQLQRSQKMEAIGTLAGGVAHDLNNILAGLVSYPELLLMDLPEDSPLRKPISTIQKSGEKAAATVQDLLTLARRGVVTTEVMNLNTIIFEYLKSPEYGKLREFHSDVTLKTDLNADLLNISGSPVHLSKTIMNLISNAAEAMPEGGTISVSTENRYIDTPIRGYDDVKQGDYVTLIVSDTGIGIPLEDREKIFEPFYTKKVMGRSGTGLGMAVVWGTVKDHNGYIDVQSREGEGTTFALYFPVTREELAKEKLHLSLEAIKGRGESILVVDDVEEQREIASSMLKKVGYSVTSVASGEEAIDYMKKNSADLLILDMIMDPGMDGLDTYKRILKLHPEQKAIIVSGFSETKRVKEAQKLGAGSYVTKPYILEKIGLAVRTELEK